MKGIYFSIYFGVYGTLGVEVFVLKKSRFRVC